MLVRESNVGFVRGLDAKEALGVGGYAFESIREGAILKPKRWFGVSKSSGNLTGYTTGTIRFRAGKDYPSYILVTKIIKVSIKEKVINFVNCGNLQTVKEVQERLNQGLTIWSTQGFMILTKIKFDSRLEIVGYSK